MIIKPYFEEDGITIYHGDARDLLLSLPSVDAIITDPVWPNPHPEITGVEDPYNLLRETAREFPRLASRCVIVLGALSDPRFLSAIPASLPFFKVVWLEHIVPGYAGRAMVCADVGYAFGRPIKFKKGQQVIPGKCLSTASDGRDRSYVSVRKTKHMRWLVRWFAEGTVLDPFCGTGTILEAAKFHGFKAIGCDINERACELSVNRLKQKVLFGGGLGADQG